MKKILIVEDDPIVGNIYRSRFEKEGFEVQIAQDGQQGFFQVSGFKPDAVLLDLMLPKMNGLDVLRKIRAQKEFEQVPVYVLTNAYVTSMIRDATTAGATAVFNKASTTPRQIMDLMRTGGITGTPAPAPASQTTRTATTTAAAQPAAVTDDKRFETEVHREFVTTSPARINDMRKHLQELRKASEETMRAAQMEQLCRKLGSYATNAGMAGQTCIAKLASATQALVKELWERPKAVAPSAFKTTAQALDCLGELTLAHVPADLADNPPVHVLVADDDTLSRRAVTMALEKACHKAVPVENAAVALEKTALMKFDLIFLDINMPGMDGFSLCEKLRESGLNKTTPIVFVTSTADFQARAQSTLQGATDLIAKPFMFIELTVNALTYALRSRAEHLRRTMRPGVRSNVAAEVVL